MSPTPQAQPAVSRCARLWVLLVLVALLAAGAHAEAMAPESDAVSASQACDAEHDVLAMAPRPEDPEGQRTATPQRPGRQKPAGPSGPDRPGSPATASARAPHSAALRAVHTVVLRC